MLERQGLWLGPWQETSSGESGGVATRAVLRARAVRDPATGEPLGVVRRHRGVDWPVLCRLARQVVQVYETEDESLLCSLRRPWGPARSWEVCDAEGRRVGLVYSRLVLDGAGSVLALVDRGPGGAGRLLGPDGVVLASVRPEEDGIVLTFLAAAERDPFTRMALLGAAVALTS